MHQAPPKHVELLLDVARLGFRHFESVNRDAGLQRHGLPPDLFSRHCEGAATGSICSMMTY
jgi:hypothetical protein